ncbi:MAG: FkbM family methyltransferase [Patescibacteria group bacterium]|nr:FkbM family methyltransferase [Patescibacteria group bacterium]
MLASFAFLKRVAANPGIGKIRTIVEIGANKCTESLDFFDSFPDADIYPFECNPDTIPICRDAIKGKARIHLIEKAASDRDGTIDFFPIDTAHAATIHEDGNTGASSLFLRNDDNGVTRERLPQRQVTVGSIALETFMREHELGSIDMLWLDAQGAELMILKGLGPRIGDVKLIQCETEFVEEYSRQPLYPEIRSFMERHGFVFCGFSSEWYPHAADSIFIRRDIFEAMPLLAKIFFRFFAALPVGPAWSRKMTYRMRRWYAGV